MKISNQHFLNQSFGRSITTFCLASLIIFCSQFVRADGHDHDHPKSKLHENMEQMGKLIKSIQTAVVDKKDLGEKTKADAVAMSDLIYQSIVLKPDLKHLGKLKPEETQLLLVKFQKIMSEALVINFELETGLLTANQVATVDAIKRLKDKRNEGHEVFKPKDQ